MAKPLTATREHWLNTYRQVRVTLNDREDFGRFTEAAWYAACHVLAVANGRRVPIGDCLALSNFQRKGKVNRVRLWAMKRRLSDRKTFPVRVKPLP